LPLPRSGPVTFATAAKQPCHSCHFFLPLPSSDFYTTIESKLEQKAGDPRSRGSRPAAGMPLRGIFSTGKAQFSLDSAPVN